MDKEMRSGNKVGYLITTLTCRHDEEGYVLNGGDFKSGTVVASKKINQEADISQVTAVTVSRNNKNELERAYKSIKKLHPDMNFIIIDCSDLDNKCCDYVCSLQSDKVTSVLLGEDVGIGKGLRAGICMVSTKYAMVFDSKIQMIKSPVIQMLKLMDEDSFGIGRLLTTDSCGYPYGESLLSSEESPTISLCHCFQIIRVSTYSRFQPYVNHVSPGFRAMNEIKKQGLSSKILKTFPVTRGSMNDYVKRMKP
jgi:hypothetical protein